MSSLWQWILVGFRIREDPHVRDVKVANVSHGDLLIESETVRRIPPRIPRLYVHAKRKGYVGKVNYDEIVSFLQSLDLEPALLAGRWELFTTNPTAPEPLIRYAREHNYDGKGDMRSVVEHLREMGMVPLRHQDGHWSIESAPDFCYQEKT